jgi:hypothetical protein
MNKRIARKELAPPLLLSLPTCHREILPTTALQSMTSAIVVRLLLASRGERVPIRCHPRRRHRPHPSSCLQSLRMSSAKDDLAPFALRHNEPLRYGPDDISTRPSNEAGSVSARFVTRQPESTSMLPFTTSHTYIPLFPLFSVSSLLRSFCQLDVDVAVP